MSILQHYIMTIEIMHSVDMVGDIPKYLQLLHVTLLASQVATAYFEYCYAEASKIVECIWNQTQIMYGVLRVVTLSQIAIR